MRIGVVIEEVADREAADNKRDAIDVALTCELVRTVGDVFLLAAEPEGLLEVVALRTDLRERCAGLLRFAIGETGKAERAVQAKPLREFGVEIDLAAVPKPRAEKGRRRPCGLQLSTGRQVIRKDLR